MKLAKKQTHTPASTPAALPKFELSSPYEYLRRLPEIYKQVENEGFAIIKAWDNSEDTLLQLARYFGRVAGHPKADARGIVTVTPEKMSNEMGKFDRNVSKTSEEFLLHTDGSFLNGICPVGEKYFRLGPPSLFLLQCVRPAVKGGESVLLDGKAVFEMLQKEQPELAVLARTTGLLNFFGGDQVALDFPLFEKVHPASYRIRFRYDLALARAEHTNSIRYLVENYFLSPRFQRRYKLEQNEVIVIDNQRVVHGRDAISLEGTEGQRLLRRTWIWNEGNGEVQALHGAFSGETFEKARIYGPLTSEDFRLRPLSLGIRTEAR